MKNANVHPDAKHQVILSKHHHLSKLNISGIHYKNAHIGREHNLCLIRKYWVPACCGVIRKFFQTVFTEKELTLDQKYK